MPSSVTPIRNVLISIIIKLKKLKNIQLHIKRQL